MNLLFSFLNLLPVFHVSCDATYGAYRSGQSCRYSLIVIVCGRAKLYLVSRYQGRFYLFSLLKFNHLNLLESQNDIDVVTEKYRSDTGNVAPQQLEIQYEFLKERFSSNEDSKSSLEARVAAHVTSYFALVGFYAYILTMILSPASGAWLARLVFGAGCLFMIACGAFIWSSMQVKGVVRSTFKDLKADTSLHTQAVLAYTNWYSSNQEVRALASEVRNVESNMIIALCIAVPLWVASQFVMSRHEAPPHSANEQTSRGGEVVNADGTLVTKNVEVLLAELGKNLPGGRKYVVVSGQRTNPNRDRIVGILTLSSGETNVSDIRLPQAAWDGASVIVKSGEATK